MRPTKDQYFLELARLVSTRSTCLRRAVGCVLVNVRGHVLATGYNGVAAGLPHCNEPGETLTVTVSEGEFYETLHPHACAGAAAPSGTSLDACQAIHAEQNALLQCRDVFEIDTCYVTVAPCAPCAKLLLGTSCRRIVAASPYPDRAGHDLWVGAGRAIEYDGDLAIVERRGNRR